MTPPARTPLRVLMTADAVGGVWTYSLALARGLGARGIGTILAVMGPRPSPAQRAAARAIDGLVLLEADYRLEWMDDAAADVEQAGAWLLALDRQYAPDIVHLNGYAHGAQEWSAPCLIVAHSCVASWWSAVKRTPLPDEGNDYLLHVHRGIAGADLVVAPTRAFGETLRHIHGVDAEVRVIPNGRDPTSFAPDFKQPFVLAAGRAWDEAKNIATLDRAAPDLRWPVFLAGPLSAPERREFAPKHLRPLGFLDETSLGEAMGRASIFVSLARYEPFGLAVLEAALSGCALVLSDIPTHRELWNECAIFVPPDDAANLVAAVNELCRNRDRLRAQGKRAWRRAQRYSVDRMVAAYAAAYAELAHRPSARRGSVRLAATSR